MNLKCAIGLHNWKGCKCAQCRATRDQDHDWKGCKCKQCDATRDEGHDWVGYNVNETFGGYQCRRCRKQNEQMKRERNTYVGRIGAIERRMKIDPRQKEHIKKDAAVGMLLDLIKEVPSSRIDGDYPFDAQLDHMTWVLQWECGDENWIGPVFKRAGSETHPGYGWIAVNLVGDDPQLLTGIFIGNGNGGSDLPRNGVSSALMDKMVSILNCADSSQPWVKKAALRALDILKVWFLDDSQKADDLKAWRQALAKFARPGVAVPSESNKPT